MPKLTKFFKGMTPENITQIFHEGHKALDIKGSNVNFGYGTPLSAPENCLVTNITDPGHIGDHDQLENGYGIRLKGLETGMDYLYWHCLPIFPVYGGDIVHRGQIVAFMGNAGNVSQGGVYVPLNQRTSAPFLGTHLHIQVEKNGVRIDPYPLINFSWEPQWNTFNFISAFMVVLKKMSQGLNR